MLVHALAVFLLSLSSPVRAAAAAAADDDNQGALAATPGTSKGTKYYTKGDLMPVTCLNRTLDTGEHITDAHGRLQYVPFATCAETDAPLAFVFGTPRTHTCTVPELPDALYHLFEFFVHSDVPLTCRVPTYPLSSGGIGGGDDDESAVAWTPLTIALQGTLQLSHLHMHTHINVLFHTDGGLDDADDDDAAALLASAAYSLPQTWSPQTPREGTKVVRNEPFALTFNVGWIEGAYVPGMVAEAAAPGTAAAAAAGGPAVVKHTVGFSLLSFFACAASAGLGAMGMLVYERRNRRSIYSNGILGGNIGLSSSSGGGGGGGGGASTTGFFANIHRSGSNHGGSGGGGGGSARSSGYGGYGGYSSSSSTTTGVAGGKRVD